MRLTGIRVGELAALRWNCVRVDHLGYSFLRVPLGKVNTERLVPMHGAAVTVLERIKAQAFIHFRTKHLHGEPEYIGFIGRGRYAIQRDYRIALDELARDINTDVAITTHRNIRTTLLYAAVAPDTVREEYFSALKRIDHRSESFTLDPRSMTPAPQSPYSVFPPRPS